MHRPKRNQKLEPKIDPTPNIHMPLRKTDATSEALPFLSNDISTNFFWRWMVIFIFYFVTKNFLISLGF